MPRRINPLITDNYYHVFNRGVNRMPIFSDRADYIHMTNLARYYKISKPEIRFSKFLILASSLRKETWKKIESEESQVDILSYCFMPNHFHLLLLQTEEGGISKFMGDFQNSYAKYFNLKSDRIGPLFQGPFKAVHIETDEQLMHVSRYIHLNPYSSVVVKKPEQLSTYSWSSFLEYISNVKFPICTKDDILVNFKKNNYKNFVLDNANYQKSLEEIKHLTFD